MGGCQTNADRRSCQFWRVNGFQFRPTNCNQLSAHLYCAPLRFWRLPDLPVVNETNLRAIVRPTSKDTRPVNLDLGTIQLPVTAYASIAHRVTGVLNFFASFLLLWALDRSLASEASFDALAAVLSSPVSKLVMWGIASALTYHALAGVKHLVMDTGVGETMRGGVIGARIVFATALTAAVLWGVAIW